MAKFSKNQVIELVKKPLNKAEVDAGKQYESRLRVFTEPKFKEELAKETAFKEFIDFMKVAISEEKTVRISDFIQYPLSACNISEGLMSDLYKVFKAGNSFFDLTAVKGNGGENVKERLAQINLIKWIEEQGKKVLKNKPNTIVVVDKDEEGMPYLIAVDNSRLIDFKLKDNFVELEYITFLHSIETDENGEEIQKIALYDEENYNVIIVPKTGDPQLESTTPHGLSFCPARMFISERLNSDGELNRRSPLAPVLAKLQEWQYFDIYKFYTDHYAPFPITEMVREKCANSECVNGKIHTSVPNGYVDDQAVYIDKYTDCPTCKGNNKIGVGATVVLDPQGDKDEPTASGKFRFINMDVSNLNYLADKLEEIEIYIKLKVVGADNIITKEAVNEKQVRGSFESKTNVLLSVKTNLDSLYKWIADTVARLMMGEDKPVTVTANFGTEWYLMSEEELQKRFENAKNIGLPEEEIDMIYKQLIETKYRGNPKKIQRLNIINELNPSPYSTSTERVEKYKNGTITRKDLIISENLTYFVRKFERENGDLVEFGSAKPFKEQVKIISEQLNKYANERIDEAQQTSGDD